MKEKPTKNEIKLAVETFIETENEFFETRYKSWATCHNFFKNLHDKNKSLSNDEKNLAMLHLGFYLASWGMYRGSSFTLKYDYNIYDEIVDILFNENYYDLWDLGINDLQNENTLVYIKSLRDAINEKLSTYRNFSKNKSILYDLEEDDKQDSEVSQTLVTKILLGTVCCCPAYDTFFKSGIPTSCNDFYSDKKLSALLEYIKSEEKFEELCKEHTEYPLMKLVDMAFFQIGLEKNFKEDYEKYILVEENLDKLDNATKDKKLKEIKKSISQFYYKEGRGQKTALLHTSFANDSVKNNIDRFIEKYLKNN